MQKLFQITLDIPASEAWVVVGDKFGETGQWTSLLDSSHLEGALSEGGYRVCHQGKKTFTEQITSFDPEHMRLEYELVKGRPPIIKSARNSWCVTPVSETTSQMSMNPNITLHWWALWLTPLLSFGLNRDLKKVMEEFKYWAETGKVHPRKKASNTPLN